MTYARELTFVPAARWSVLYTVCQSYCPHASTGAGMLKHYPSFRHSSLTSFGNFCSIYISKLNAFHILKNTRKANKKPQTFSFTFFIRTFQENFLRIISVISKGLLHLVLTVIVPVERMSLSDWGQGLQKVGFAFSVTYIYIKQF